MAFFFTVSFTVPAALSQTVLDNHLSFMEPRKIMYDEDEVTLPNSLHFNDQTNGSAGIALLHKNLVVIQWQTAYETNTSHFELQRRENGKDFAPIETVTAAGFSDGLTCYATSDKKPGIFINTISYRVKTVFINGKEDLTPAFQVNLHNNPAGLNNTFLLTGYVSK